MSQPQIFVACISSFPRGSEGGSSIEVSTSEITAYKKLFKSLKDEGYIYDRHEGDDEIDEEELKREREEEEERKAQYGHGEDEDEDEEEKFYSFSKITSLVLNSTTVKDVKKWFEYAVENYNNTYYHEEWNCKVEAHPQSSRSPSPSSCSSHPSSFPPCE
jgi:hypothetical protein